MRPLRIALLSRWYADENRRAGTVAGGTVQQLAEAVARLGHEVVVLSQGSGVRRLEQGRIGALETWLAPRERRRPGLPALRDRWEKRRFGHRKLHSDALDLRDFLAARGPFDALWAQCEEPDGLVAAHAARIGVALPPTLTQIYALRYTFAKARPLFTAQAALGAAFAQATRILANSELVAGSLSAYATPACPADRLRDKTRVVYHNLQHEFLAAARGDGPPAEPGRVLFLGALNEKKGVLDFLDAIAQTEAAHRQATFVVVGGETEKNAAFTRAWQRRRAELDVKLPPHRLEWLGKISAVETIAQIQRASVVVLPSLFDEFSRALAESLVLGRPVITTTGVGAAGFVRGATAGLVIAPGDPAALARAIDELLRPDKPYAAAAHRLAPRLTHELSPHAIALQIAHHLAEIVPA